MTCHGTLSPGRRAHAFRLRLRLILASAVALIGLAHIDAVRAQQPSTPLPPVAVDPPAKPKPAPAPVQKQAAPDPAPAKPAPVAKKAAPAKAVPKKAPESQIAAPKAEPPPPANPATALGSYNPALDVGSLELPPGTVLTTAGPVVGYQALTAMSATKTATPIEQIPQSMQVIPRSVIQDQGSLSVGEAIQNASNVQGPNARSLGDTQLFPYTIRGFGAQAWLDGMVMPYSAGDRDALANIERIEVLKGPNAILYGGGAGAPVGGAINLVSKLPTNKASGEFGVTYGSFNHLSSFFDINQPLTANGTVLFRVTGEYTSANSFIDTLDIDKYSLNPTLTLTNKSDTTLTIQGRISSAKQQTYQGLPVTGTILGGFKLDPSMFLGPKDIPRGFSEVQGITVTLDHRFDETWSANVKARWSRSAFEQNTQLIVGSDAAGGIPAIAPSTWLLANVELHQQIQEFSVNPSLQARFDIGGTKNTLLFGADYSRVRDTGFLHADYLGNGCAAFFGVGPCFGLVGPTVDLRNPSFTTPYVDPRAKSQYQDIFGFNQIVSFGDNHNVFTTQGAYGQIQSTFFDRVHLLLGLRSASIEIDQIEESLGFPTRTVTDAHKLLPRAGVVVDLVPGLSVFASYSEGMRAFPRQLPSGKSEPEYSEQHELGARLKLGNALTATVAYFEIERDNVVVNLGGLAGIAFARQKSSGFETDVVWQPLKGLQVLASYGYTHAVFADGLLGAKAGNHFPIVPEHSGRLWVTYAFDHPALRGWSAGAGIYAASSQYVDAANLYRVDGYFTVDARIAYETESFRAALTVRNLTGEDYFVPYAFLGAQVAPGDERAIYGTVSYRY